VSLYLYAVIDEEPSSLEAPLRLVRCGVLLIVVGEEAPALTPENLAAQDAVVRRLSASAVLPIRFGEKVQDEEELCKLLKPRSSDLIAALERVRGCEQMTLRVFGEPAPLPEPVEQGGPGTRYLEARRREIERAHSLPEIEPLLERLRPLVKAERIERKEQGRLLGTVYHLVRKEDVPAYKEAAKDDRVTLSGPFPPYAFAPGLET